MITTRRSFCTNACHAASLAAAAGIVLTGCGSDSNPASPSTVGGGTSTGGGTGTPPLSSVPNTLNGRTVSVTVTGTSLANVGGAATTVTGIGTFLISQPSQDSFTVLTAICTHEACTIDGFANSRYVCPCHGSQYSTSGTVLVGPATQNLRAFPSSFSGGVLTFTA